MRLRGKLAELMVMTAPEIYKKYVVYDSKRRPILYLKLVKALYGCLRSALLFYLKLMGDLLEYGFEINPYDPCVANKLVNGKQLTVTFWVDDLKVSHEDSNVVTKFIKWLEDKYGKMRTSRGKKHDYLGMDMDFSTPGYVKIGMVNYIQSTIKDFPEKITKTANTPASSHLFNVNEHDEKLCNKMAAVFHHVVARLLFACKRARPDIQTAIAFLTTRVQSPGMDDWKKLRRVLRYLYGTQHMRLTLGANNSREIEWWVDASYGVHPNMRSHTGSVMSFGYGCAQGFSGKQKLNVRSSTEAELVGVDDRMSDICWLDYFLTAQGYALKTWLNQDNKSAILLEQNGKQSSGKRTRHIDIRYFFIKDRVDKGQVSLRYCPTEEMLADFFTKPLQGAQFKRIRAMIMYIPHEMDVRDRMKEHIISAETEKQQKHLSSGAGVCWNNLSKQKENNNREANKSPRVTKDVE